MPFFLEMLEMLEKPVSNVEIVPLEVNCDEVGRGAVGHLCCSSREVKAGDVLQSNSPTFPEDFFAFLCVLISPRNTSHTKEAL